MIRLVILRLLESYFRHKWLNLLPLLAFTILGVVYILFKPQEYMTNAILSVQDSTVLNSLTQIGESGYVWVTPAEATTEQIGELGQTNSFIRAIIMQTALEENMTGGTEEIQDTMDEVRQSVSTAIIGEKNISIIGVHEDPTIALQLVEATAESFLQWNINQARSDSASAEQFFSDLTVEYKAQRDEASMALEDYLALHPRPIRGERPAIEELQIEGLESDIAIHQNNYIDALSKLETARLGTAQAEEAVRQTYLIIDTPVFPEKPNTSKRQLAVSGIIFSVVGAVISVVAVIAGALLDRTMRFPIDVHQALELPVLAAVPAGTSYAADSYERTPPPAQYRPKPKPVAPINGQSNGQSSEHSRARLIPLVEPPTLIIMPNERTQVEPITQERKRYEEAARYHSQEREYVNGFADHHVEREPNPDDLPTTVSWRPNRR